MENGVLMLLAMVAGNFPFELQMQDLRHVLRSHCPIGASLTCLGKVFELINPDLSVIHQT
jgi:hypothetical protein